MGGRVASMIEADGPTSDGLVLFGYPLHPSSQPEKLRTAHLPTIVTPTLQMNGTEDPLCTKEIMEQVVAGLNPAVWRLRWIEGADHSYAVKKSSGRTRHNVEEDVRTELGEWFNRVLNSPS
jgi:predicted alpha/beta-hydrolase family hydrolase